MTKKRLDEAYTTAIAIIGMSGRFPGANTVEAFWANIAAGHKSIRFFSDEELLEAGVAPEDLKQPDYVKAGAIIQDIEDFDASFFGYTPREAEIMDPQQRIFLEVAWEALESAGYDAETYKGMIGVFAGSAISTYLLNNIFPQPEIVELMGPLQTSLGNDKDSLATRVSYKLNLRGPGIAVQTYCSTSLVAVHLACQSLLNYECDMVLAGGVALSVPQKCGYLYQEGGILSPDGECRTFDAGARGSVMGNGAGAVVLKRFTEALDDGDQIYAVIRGSAVNNDGRFRVSYTAPGLEGQSEVIAEALANAGVEAEAVSYIEAHGTATELGDSIELAAMMKAFGLSTQKKQFCAIGSVKPNVGHLDRASGVTGLIKTTLALHHKQLPPSLNFTQPNSDVDLINSPFYVNTALARWEQQASSPRRAGTSSFGLGGTNAHVVLEEAPERDPGSPSRSAQLLLLSARTETALQRMTENLALHLRQHPELDLADVAHTLQVGRGIFPYRRMLVCANREEAIELLEQPGQERVYTLQDAYRDRQVVFLLGGVGEQYASMASDLYRQEPFFREQTDHCLLVLKQRVGLDLTSLLFAEDKEGHHQQPGLDLKALLGRKTSLSQADLQLKQTALAQPAIFMIEYALARLLMHWGLQPKALLGHSLGEYVAACLSGVLSLEDALLVVAKRAEWIQNQQPGAMLAVELSEVEVQPFLEQQIELAIVHGVQQCVLAGPEAAIAALEERLKGQDIAARRVEATHAFHTSMLEPVRKALTTLLASIKLHKPAIPYISNVTGTWITAEQATSPAYWAEHMCSRVNFLQGMETLLQEQQCVALEIGLGQALSSYLKQFSASRGGTPALVFSTLPSRYHHQPDMQAVLAALGKLWLTGVQIDWSAFYEHEQRLRVPLPTYPFERQRYWIAAPQGSLQKQVALVDSGKKADSADWFYAPLWKQTALTQGKLANEPGPWLLFVDSAGLGEQLARKLREQNHRVICVYAHDAFVRRDEQTYALRPGERGDYEALSKELKAHGQIPRTVIHCWSAERDTPAADGQEYFQEKQQTGFYSLLFLLQTLSAQAYSQPLRIFVFSSHIQAVYGLEQLHPEKATIIGLCRVIPQEYIDTICRNVDILLPEKAEDAWDQRLISALTDEVLSDCIDPIAAYRGLTRWTQIYEPRRLDGASEPERCFRRNGVYLITGGLGGIGLYLTEYLARTVQATCVLITRSPFPDRQDWSAWLEQHAEEDPISGAIRRLLAIEQGGASVLVINADAADPLHMSRAVERVYQQYGALHGIFHAAGSSADIGFRPIQDIDREGCETHFRPKGAAIFALEQALQDRKLDFCLVFSSLSAVLGGLGFAAYAAANIFMDAYIYKHRQQPSDTPWRSVNWDTWRVKANAHGVLGATIARYEMTPEEGLTALVKAMGSGELHLVNSTGNLEARICQWVQTNSGAAKHEGSASMGRPALSTAYAPPENEIEERIVQIWQQLLGLEKIGIRDNFFELGGHSLTGTRLISRLRQEFQVNIPLASLFEAATVEDLALVVGELLLEEIERSDGLLLDAS